MKKVILFNLTLILISCNSIAQKKEKETKMENLGYLSGLQNAIRKPLLGPTLMILFIVALAFSTIPVLVSDLVFI